MQIETVGKVEGLVRRAVWVHGNDLCGEFYRPLAEGLAERGVVSDLLTLPGFDGQAPLPDPSWSALAARIAAAVEAVAPAALIGHSMGGLLAFLAAARRPRGLTRLVLLEPAIFPTPWVAGRASGRYLADVVHGDRQAFVNQPGRFRRIAEPASFPAAAMACYLRSRRRSHLPTMERLFSSLEALCPLPFAAVRWPTLLLWGTRSGWPGRLQARKLKRLFPYAHLDWIQGAAHFMANEQDALIAARIDAFLDRADLGHPAPADHG